MKLSRSLLLITAVITSLCASSALADEIHLKNGKVISGLVVDEGARYTVVDRDRKFAIKKSLVKKVAESNCFMSKYQARLDKLPVDDAEAIFEFGRWLDQNDWSSRAKLAYREVLDLDPDHRGARRALSYSMYEGEWVSPDELNRKKGLVEFAGGWYTKHDLAELKKEIESNKKLRIAYAERRRINDKVNRIVQKFATFNKKKRAKAYNELYQFAEQVNSPELRKFADDTKAHFDRMHKILCAKMMARTEIQATHTQLKKPIDVFQTALGAAIALNASQNPVRIQLPELSVAKVQTTVDIPAGC